ncbi:MAG: hypothetical protein R3272_06345 [Candidatus Promineifilaceae bacterium]|nr:hypothetical protein [Candidatus Promineifilaceae bacterium]
MADQQFEYRVCAMQNNRITFANGAWQGALPPDGEDPNAALASCPAVWDYLEEAGQAGWELVSTVNQTVADVEMQTLFLKRRR